MISSRPAVTPVCSNSSCSIVNFDCEVVNKIKRVQTSCGGFGLEGRQLCSFSSSWEHAQFSGQQCLCRLDVQTPSSVLHSCSQFFLNEKKKLRNKFSQKRSKQATRFLFERTHCSSQVLSGTLKDDFVVFIVLRFAFFFQTKQIKLMKINFIGNASRSSFIERRQATSEEVSE